MGGQLTAACEIGVGWALLTQKGPQFFSRNTVLVTNTVIVDAGIFNEG